MNLHILRQTLTFLLCFSAEARFTGAAGSASALEDAADTSSTQLALLLKSQLALYRAKHSKSPDVVLPQLPTDFHAEPGFVKSVLEGSDGPGNMMGPINKFRAKVCSDMKDEHGKRFGSFEACDKFMRKACNPGRDRRMDGDKREITSGEGFCKKFFGTEVNDEKQQEKTEEKAAAPEPETLVPTAPEPEPVVVAAAPAPAPAPAGAPAPYRPTHGDTVTILSTPNTKKTFPEGIGKNFTIKIDEHTAQPYQVEGSSAWLFENDVQLAKKKVPLPDEKWYYKNGGTDVGRYHMDESLKLPSQGYWGKLVEHEDMQTGTGDWQKEGGRNSKSRRKICETHPENTWCQQYIGALDAEENERSGASAVTMHRVALALAMVFMCGVSRQ
jgi:hypothetical protein